MTERGKSAYYVTGTDTGVGKTFASVALLRAFAASGRTVAGMKPVASGCIATPDGLCNEDALLLQAASRPRPDYELVNPFALEAATAPQIAASIAGVRVSLPAIAAAYGALRDCHEVIVVEGVGGWLAPMADGLEQSAVARVLELPVILVVGLKLGCLNHARLSERAILADGLSLAGWIGNAVDDGLEYAEEYRALLLRELGAPCLGFIAHAAGAEASHAAATLRLPEPH